MIILPLPEGKELRLVLINNGVFNKKSDADRLGLLVHERIHLTLHPKDASRIEIPIWITRHALPQAKAPPMITR